MTHFDLLIMDNQKAVEQPPNVPDDVLLQMWPIPTISTKLVSEDFIPPTFDNFPIATLPFGATVLDMKEVPEWKWKWKPHPVVWDLYSVLWCIDYLEGTIHAALLPRVANAVAPRVANAVAPRVANAMVN